MLGARVLRDRASEEGGNHGYTRICYKIYPSRTPAPRVNARNASLRRNEGHLFTEPRANSLRIKHSFVNENAKHLAIVNNVREDEFSVKEEEIWILSYQTIINYAPMEMIEDTVEFVSMLPLSQETLVNNFVVEHRKSNNVCYIPCDKPMVMDPPIVIFEPCIITLQTSEVFDAQGNNFYHKSKLEIVSPLTSFSKKEKNKTMEEFKLWCLKTRE